MKALKHIIMLGLTLTLFSACGDEDGADANNEHMEESPAAEACEHMAEGPAEGVTATADATGAPAIDAEHTRFDVTLVEVEGGYEGYVSFESSDATEVTFYLSADDTLSITDSDGTAVALEDAHAVDECTEVATANVYDLEVGTYTLRISSENPAVSVVAEAGEHVHTEE